MCVDGTWQRVRGWRGVALQAATFIALIAGSSSTIVVQASATTGRNLTQSMGGDPCRFASAEVIGKAFGRSMKSSKRRVDVCEYQGTGTELVVVKVTAGSEGTILRHLRTVLAQGQKGPEKVSTAIGEAYFDSTFPVFVGRVGNDEVQLETTIDPVPRDAMIVAGLGIMKTLAGK